jgi:predicted flavoprotein YhiN
VADAAAVVGGGPAGLMAAEALLARGVAVDLYDAMPSVGRKFLLAGKGGLNLTHTERRPGFDARYGARRAEIARLLDAFDGDALRAWADALGAATFVGTSGRVFPSATSSSSIVHSAVPLLHSSYSLTLPLSSSSLAHFALLILFVLCRLLLVLELSGEDSSPFISFSASLFP